MNIYEIQVDLSLILREEVIEGTIRRIEMVNSKRPTLLPSSLDFEKLVRSAYRRESCPFHFGKCLMNDLLLNLAATNAANSARNLKQIDLIRIDDLLQVILKVKVVIKLVSSYSLPISKQLELFNPQRNGRDFLLFSKGYLQVVFYPLAGFMKLKATSRE